MMLQFLGRIALALVALSVAVAAQNPPRAAFEVASVRLVETRTPPRRTQTDTRLDLVSVPLREVMLTAFGIEVYRLVVPDWFMEEQPWVEIHATLPAGTTRQQVPQMLQTLLVERFGMVAHAEARPIDVCELTVGKGGLKAREVEPIDELDASFPSARSGPDDSRPFDTVSGPPESRIRTVIQPDRGIRYITARTNYVIKTTASGTMV